MDKRFQASSIGTDSLKQFPSQATEVDGYGLQTWVLRHDSQYKGLGNARRRQVVQA